jgi:hypothetical protein
MDRLTCESGETGNPFECVHCGRVSGMQDECPVRLRANLEECNRDLADAQQAYLALLNDERLPNGEYVHIVWCNVLRDLPVGARGCSCPLGARIHRVGALPGYALRNARQIALEAAALVCERQPLLSDFPLDEYAAEQLAAKIRALVTMDEYVRAEQEEARAARDAAEQCAAEVRRAGVLHGLDLAIAAASNTPTVPPGPATSPIVTEVVAAICDVRNTVVRETTAKEDR